MHAWLKEDYPVSTDPSLLDVEAIHAFLSRPYWAEGIAKSAVARPLSIPSASACIRARRKSDTPASFPTVLHLLLYATYRCSRHIALKHWVNG